MSVSHKIAAIMMRLAMGWLSEADKEWRTAMMAEWLESGKSVRFAVGCGFAAGRRNLEHNLWEPLGRFGLCSCITAWAAAKFYAASLVFRSDVSVLIVAGLILTGVLYAGVAGLLWAKRWRYIFGAVLIVMTLNALLFFSVSLPITTANTVTATPRPSVMMLALIGEEYFILTGTIFGLLFIRLWQNRFRSRAGLHL